MCYTEVLSEVAMKKKPVAVCVSFYLQQLAPNARLIRQAEETRFIYPRPVFRLSNEKR